MTPPKIQTVLLTLAAVVAALAILLPWFDLWRVPWVVTLYTGNGLVAFFAYANDKRRAARNEARWSEGALHLLELAGGFVGAFVAQRLWRHKTRKVPYQLVFWVIVAAHAALWAWWLFGTSNGEAA